MSRLGIPQMGFVSQIRAETGEPLNSDLPLKSDECSQKVDVFGMPCVKERGLPNDILDGKAPSLGAQIDRVGYHLVPGL